MLRWKEQKEQRNLAVERHELLQRENNCRHNDEKTQRLDARLQIRSNLVEDEKVNAANSHTANMEQLRSVREANSPDYARHTFSQTNIFILSRSLLACLFF
jgi:hypothetical protein